MDKSAMGSAGALGCANGAMARHPLARGAAAINKLYMEKFYFQIAPALANIKIILSLSLSLSETWMSMPRWLILLYSVASSGSDRATEAQ